MLILSLSQAATVMFPHHYTNWFLLDAGPVLDPYTHFFSLDPNAVTAVLLLLLFSCSGAQDFFQFSF